jgi:hypothetical protein
LLAAFTTSSITCMSTFDTTSNENSSAIGIPLL